ncbi:hypothetical protein [Pseudomonas xanthosomatis]
MDDTSEGYAHVMLLGQALTNPGQHQLLFTRKLTVNRRLSQRKGAQE